MTDYNAGAGTSRSSEKSSIGQNFFPSMPSQILESREEEDQKELLQAQSPHDENHSLMLAINDGFTGKGKGKATDKTLSDFSIPSETVDVPPPSAPSPAPAPASIHVQTRYQIVDIPTQIGVEGQGMSFDEILHPGIFCDGPHCEVNALRERRETIWGNRFHCMSCKNVDFCSRCIREPANTHDPLHGFVRCIFPVRISRLYPDDQKEWEKTRAIYPEYKDVTVSHFIATETLRNWVPPSVRSFLPDCRPTVFGISPTVNFRPEKPSIIRPDHEPQGDESHVAVYNIDKSGRTTLSFQKASDQRRDVRQHGVLHHDSSTLVAAMTGEIRRYDYGAKRDFYDLVPKVGLATRLIDIKPGRDDQKVEFELRAVDLSNLDQLPYYETLSYTWKEMAQDRAIMNGWQDHMGNLRDIIDIKRAFYAGTEYVEVSQGLHDAIVRLRDPQVTRTMWIDQICINQHDEKEKSYQVERMAGIYRRASSSTLWVGEHDSDSRKALDIIRAVTQIFQDNAAASIFSDPLELIALSEGRLPSSDSTDWLSVLQFFLRPVWNRVWIIQEFVLASKVNVQCGYDTLPLQMLTTFAKMIIAQPWIRIFDKLGASKELIQEQSNLKYVVQMNGIREDWYMRKPLSFERLLYFTAGFQATDLRDKVYGILGIQIPTPRTTEDILIPDYSKSVSETMVAAAKHVVSRHNSLGLIGLNSTLSSKETPGLPSWCPDLAVASTTSPWALNRPEPPPPYGAHGSSEVTVMWPYESHPQLMVTSSVKVDTVSAVTQGDIILDNLGSALIEGTALASGIGRFYKTGEYIEDVFCRVLHANTTFMFRKPFGDDLLASTSIVISRLGSEYIANHQDEAEVSDLVNPVFATLAVSAADFEATDRERYATSGNEASEEFHLASRGLSGLDLALSGILTTCKEKRILQTENHFLGIGAMDVKPGDEVHVLSGANVPVILRPLEYPEALRPDEFDDSLRSYVLIGEAYVHGIMNGELCQGEEVDWAGICIH